MISKKNDNLELLYMIIGIWAFWIIWGSIWLTSTIILYPAAWAILGLLFLTLNFIYDRIASRRKPKQPE